MFYKAGDKVNNKYLIIEKLGNGAMGEVYRAEQMSLHKQVALKLMHVHLTENPESLGRFKREARAAANLEHPHICVVTDFDKTEQGDFYIAMEYLQGETLKSRLAREGTIELRSVFRIMDDLLSALQCAHENNVIHRDVKPDNIMLKNREGRNDFVKLIDFGIAHADAMHSSMNGPLTEAGKVYGTPQYLSPEQVMGDPVDCRADLYSCGCTLYEMLMGAPPFEGHSYMILLNKHLSLEPPHLNEFPCSEQLDVVIQKLLQKDPNDRYGSALEVRNILNAIYETNFPDKDVNHSLILSKAGITKSSNDNTDITINDKTVQDKDFDVEESTFNKSGKIIVATMGVIIIALFAALIYLTNEMIQLRDTLTHMKQTLPDVNNTPDPNAQNTQLQNPQAPSQESHESHSTFVITHDDIDKYAVTECILAQDDDLYKVKDIRDASTTCLNKEYEKSFKILSKYLDVYTENQHFMLMYLVDSYATQNDNAVMNTLIALFEADPSIACDPAVRDIIYSYVEDDEKYEKLQISFKTIPSRRVANGLAWLILDAPCNQYEKRFNRLLESYDAVFDDNTPKWLSDSVKIWRPYKKSGSCDDRAKNVIKYLNAGMDEACIPGQEYYDTARCSVCHEKWRKRKKL